MTAIATDVGPVGGKLTKADQKKVNQGRTAISQGSALSKLGQHEAADRCYKDGIALLSRTLPGYHSDIINAYIDAGYMWITQHHFPRAEPHYTQAHRSLQTGLARYPTDLTMKQQQRKVLRDLAYLHYLQGSLQKPASELQRVCWKKAEEALEKVIYMTEHELGRSAEELVQPLRNLASLYVKTGDLHRSELCFKRCIGVQLLCKGLSDPALLVTRQQLAIVYERKGQQRSNNAALAIQGGWRVYSAKMVAHRKRNEKRAGKARGSGEAAALGLAPSTPAAQPAYFTPGTEGFDDWHPEENASGLHGGGGSLQATLHPTDPSLIECAMAGITPENVRSPLLPPTLSQPTTALSMPNSSPAVDLLAADQADPLALSGGGAPAATPASAALSAEEMELLNCFPSLAKRGK